MAASAFAICTGPRHNGKDHARADSHISAMREDRSKSRRRIEPRAGIDHVIVGR